MLTKSKIKFLQELQTKKGRHNSNLFVAEGLKIVEELINSDIRVIEIYTTEGNEFQVLNSASTEVVEVNEAELKKISALVTPNVVIAVAEIPLRKLNVNELINQLTLVLDDIQDPGNLGTIIRIADWFGISTIICSLNTVDCYNPKVVQASMGSIARVKIFYENINKLGITDLGLNIYGAVLDGKNIYEESISSQGIIVIGNESKGITDEVQTLLTNKITVPNYSHLKNDREGAESLNAAIATAIICAEFRRITNSLPK